MACPQLLVAVTSIQPASLHNAKLSDMINSLGCNSRLQFYPAIYSVLHSCRGRGDAETGPKYDDDHYYEMIPKLLKGLGFHDRGSVKTLLKVLKVNTQQLSKVEFSGERTAAGICPQSARPPFLIMQKTLCFLWLHSSCGHPFKDKRTPSSWKQSLSRHVYFNSLFHS